MYFFLCTLLAVANNIDLLVPNGLIFDYPPQRYPIMIVFCRHMKCYIVLSWWKTTLILQHCEWSHLVYYHMCFWTVLNSFFFFHVQFIFNDLKMMKFFCYHGCHYCYLPLLLLLLPPPTPQHEQQNCQLYCYACCTLSSHSLINIEKRPWGMCSSTTSISGANSELRREPGFIRSRDWRSSQ